MKSLRGPLIISRSDLVSRWRRLLEWGITLFFWCSLAYLWQPLLSFAAGWMDLDWMRYHRVLLTRQQNLGQMIAYDLPMIAGLGGALILWARINQWRFRGKERRRGAGATNMEQLRNDFGASLADIQVAAESAIVTVVFADNERVSHIRREASRPPPACPPHRPLEATPGTDRLAG